MAIFIHKAVLYKLWTTNFLHKTILFPQEWLLVVEVLTNAKQPISCKVTIALTRPEAWQSNVNSASSILMTAAIIHNTSVDFCKQKGD